MLPALLTTLLYSISAVAASRMTRILGGIEANFWRILLATSILGVGAHTLGWGFAGVALPWFLLSGFIGFGIGDLALYQALPILGSRLSMIMVHCLAAPLSAAVEWYWLGTVLKPIEMLCSLVILAGVAIALSPEDHLHLPAKVLLFGVTCGIIAACGQGFGAVISRKAYIVASAAGQDIDGMTAAYQRIWGGVAIAIISFVIWKVRTRNRELLPGQAGPKERLKKSAGWLILNCFAGPALGVSCFQWALKTTPTGIVLPIVALTPLTIIPLSTWIEGERPSRRSLFGGLLAVAGVVALRSSFGN
jgi:drug/metabolite transporter (DMT)-like permease